MLKYFIPWRWYFIEDCLTVHLLHEIMWNANLMQQANFTDVFLARHVSGTQWHQVGISLYLLSHFNAVPSCLPHFYNLEDTNSNVCRKKSKKNNRTICWSLVCSWYLLEIMSASYFVFCSYPSNDATIERNCNFCRPTDFPLIPAHEVV